MLGEPAGTLTHVVAAPRTFVYPGPDLKLPRAAELSIGCSRDRGRPRRAARHALCAAAVRRGGGRRHTWWMSTLPSQTMSPSPRTSSARPICGAATAASASIARGWCNSPCAWPDAKCCAIPTCRPKPSASRCDPSAGLQRGDLMFWKGHVAIVADPATLLHASGHVMQVVSRATSTRRRADRKSLRRGDRFAQAVTEPKRTAGVFSSRRADRRGQSAARPARRRASASPSAAPDGSGPRSPRRAASRRPSDASIACSFAAAAPFRTRRGWPP